jgi:hypothetical protein
MFGIVRAHCTLKHTCWVGVKTVFNSIYRHGCLIVFQIPVGPLCNDAGRWTKFVFKNTTPTSNNNGSFSTRHLCPTNWIFSLLAMGTPKNRPGSSNKKTTTTPKPPSSTKEKKNRVIVARPPKNPAPPSSTHSTTRDSDSESVLSQASSASSLRSALPVNIQKQLAQDIEERGGIELLKGNSSHCLSALCNENEETYGKRGDPIRTKIGKKVQVWKHYDKAEYTDKVLNRLQVQSAATIHYESRSNNEKKYKKKVSLQHYLSDDEDSSSDSSSDSDDKEDSSVTSIESIPRRILFSNQESTMQEQRPSQSAAIPMGSGKLLFVFVINA